MSGAVAGDEKSQLAARRFDRLVDFTRRRRETFRVNFEVIDEPFDGRFHFFAGWGNNSGSGGLDGPFRRDFFHGLADDFDAFANFRYADLITREAVARGLRLNVEIKLFIARVGKSLADVERHAAAAQHGARSAHGNGIFGADDSHALRSAEPDAVIGEQAFVFVNVRGKGIDYATDVIEPVRRRLEGDAADAEIAGHHPLARDVFENLHDLFALAEGVEEDGHGAEIDCVRAEPDEVRSDARHFSEQDANVLRALGNFDSENFFYRETVAEIVRKWGEVVDAVGHRDGLRIGFRFH